MKYRRRGADDPEKNYIMENRAGSTRPTEWKQGSPYHAILFIKPGGLGKRVDAIKINNLF